MTDFATIQIFANHLRAAAETMAYTLYRTAQSTFVKETEDFSIGLVTPEGLTCAVPLDFGITWYPGLDYGPVIRMMESYEDGDICMTNDPYSGFVATHTPDVHMWRPVYHDGDVVCFAVGHIHNTDMGGAVPASLSSSLTEIHQEGVRVPPTKLMRAGNMNQELLSFLLTNVRKPDQNKGDMEAFIGALNTGAREVEKIIGKFGIEPYRAGLHDMLDFAETQAREIIRSMPNGTYAFSDFCDEDSPNGVPCRLNLKATVADDAIELDFSGSDPQLTSSLNIPTGGDPRHTLLLVGAYYVLYTLNPNLLLNAGITRPFTCILPEGSVLNPTFPAAVGMRSLTVGRLRSVLFGTFAQIVPDRMPAAPAGSSCIANVMTTDSTTGRSVLAAVNPIVGGGGGMPDRDGADGSGADAAYLKNTPIEITEAEVPIEILRYGLVPDSGGAGRWRGGLGSWLEFKVFAPHSRITIRNRDRCRFRPWGILGGQAGMPSNVILNPGTESELVLGNRDFVEAEPGDIIRIFSPGGGGRGFPWKRDLECVQEDVRNGYVSHTEAKNKYGVVIANDSIDHDATNALRSSMEAREKNTNVFFNFGPERELYEETWTREAYDELMAVLYSIPVQWRFFIKHRIFRELETADVSERGTIESVRRAFQTLMDKYPAAQSRGLSHASG